MEMTKNLSPYAKRIVEESLDKIKTEHVTDSSAKIKGVVRSVVSELSFEAGPDKRDGIVNSALLEIVQSYIGHLAKETIPAE